MAHLGETCNATLPWTLLVISSAEKQPPSLPDCLDRSKQCCAPSVGSPKSTRRVRRVGNEDEIVECSKFDPGKLKHPLPIRPAAQLRSLALHPTAISNPVIFSIERPMAHHSHRIQARRHQRDRLATTPHKLDVRPFQTADLSMMSSCLQRELRRKLAQ